MIERLIFYPVRVVDRYILYFLGVWAVYFFVLAIVPLTSMNGSLSAAVFAEILFVAIVALIASMSRSDIKGDSSELRPLEPQLASDIVVIGVALSVIGVAALTFDRMAVQGISYSEGIAVAREQWRRAGEAREGISSIYSVLGYAFSTSFFVSLAVLVIQFETLPKWLLRTSVPLIFVVMMGGSVIAGGRSILLLTGALVASFYCIRIESGTPPIRLSAGTKILFGLIAITAFAYMLYIFAARAALGQFELASYARDFVLYLGAQPDSWMISLSDANPVDRIISLIVLTLAYFCHSAYTVAAILEMPKENAIIMFGFPLSLLAKLGVIAPVDTDWALAGRFPSVPGSLYHDFGPAGLIGGACLLGLGCGMVQQLRHALPNSVVLIGTAAGLYATLFISPIILAPDIMSFPFIMLEFILVPAAAYGVAMLRRHRAAYAAAASL